MELILMRNSYFRKLREVIKSVCTELIERLEEHQREDDQLMRIYSVWLSKTDEVILSLQGILHEIEKHQLNVNIASIAGSSVSFLGGAACVGLVLAPVTGGVSLALATGGIVCGAAGTLTSQGAKIVRCGLKLPALERASKLVADHCEETIKFTAQIQAWQFNEENILNFLRTSTLVQEIRANEAVYMKMFNNEEMQEILLRIVEESASLNDYILFIRFVGSEDLGLLNRYRKIKVLNFSLAVIRNVGRTCQILYTSSASIRELSTIIGNWRSGFTTVKLASNASRASKIFLGLSMVSDVYDIATCAHEIATNAKPGEIRDLQNIINELQWQRNEIVQLFH